MDCTLTGCPTATTGTCVLIDSTSGEGLATTTETVDASRLSFYAISLVTPLPDAAAPECGTENADRTTLTGTRLPSSTENGSGAGATETGAAGPDSAASKVVGSWGAIAAVAALALAA